MSEELLRRALQLRQESEEIEQQLGFITEQIKELESFRESLAVLEQSSEKEILSHLGRGVYLKNQRASDGRLFVDVGANILVRKTPTEARKIITEQIKKFIEARTQLIERLEAYKQEFGAMVRELEEIKK